MCGGGYFQKAVTSGVYSLLPLKSYFCYSHDDGVVGVSLANKVHYFVRDFLDGHRVLPLIIS